MPPPPPPKKRRRGLIAVLAVAAVVVPAGMWALADAAFDAAGTDAATSPSPSVSRTIVVPSSFGPYRRMTGGDADKIEKDMRATMNEDQVAGGPGFSEAKVAVFERRDGSSMPMIFVGLAASDGPSAAKQLEAVSPSEQIDGMFDGLGLGAPKPYPAGPLGGLLRCGAGTTEDGPGAACAWADSSTLGLLVRSGDGGVAALAAATLALRNAAEH